MNWSFWRKRNEVLIVGYSLDLLNGVSKNTDLLLRSIPYLRLHVAVRCWNPRWRWLAYTLLGLVTFTFRLLFAAPQVVQIILGSRGDTVKTLPYLCLGKLRGCKVSLHFRMTKANLTGELPRLIRGLVHWLWRRADCYCFLSRRLSEEFTAEINPRKARVIIPNPISHEWLRQDILQRSERSRDLVFLGRWSVEKGIDDLQRAMRTLDIGASVQCDIYSDVLPKQNPKGCDCHPWVSEDEVRRVLREAKLLLLPSHFEGYPNILVQAAACGTPFVATDVAGIPDIVEASKAGLLHQVGDISGMRQAIVTLLTDGVLWTKCSSNGRLWAQSLEVSEVVLAWHRLYADLGVRVSPHGNPRVHCRPTAL